MNLTPNPWADLKGGGCQGINSFNFMQFLGKKNWLNNNFSLPPLELALHLREILDPRM